MEKSAMKECNCEQMRTFKTVASCILQALSQQRPVATAAEGIRASATTGSSFNSVYQGLAAFCPRTTFDCAHCVHLLDNLITF